VGNQPGRPHVHIRHPGNVKFQNLAPLNGRLFVAEDARFASIATDRRREPAVFTRSTRLRPDTKTLVIKMKRPQPDFIFPLATAYTTIHTHELVDDGASRTRRSVLAR